jgi:hypothetical protein
MRAALRHRLPLTATAAPRRRTMRPRSVSMPAQLAAAAWRLAWPPQVRSRAWRSASNPRLPRPETFRSVRLRRPAATAMRSRWVTSRRLRPATRWRSATCRRPTWPIPLPLATTRQRLVRRTRRPAAPVRSAPPRSAARRSATLPAQALPTASSASVRRATSAASRTWPLVSSRRPAPMRSTAASSTR